MLKSVIFTTIIAMVLTIQVCANIAHAEAFDVDPESGYRMDRYRAAVPTSIPDGITVDTAFVQNEHKAGNMVFIDVFPPKGMGADPIDGFWMITEPRLSIPGTTWLPEVGRGFLEPAHEDFFRRNLQRLSNNNQATPLLFFCTSDCWQSWNAAKRAISWGYENVHWYPNGTDGWLENDNSVVEIAPVNFINDTTPVLFPQQADIQLVTGAGDKLRIGSVSFKNKPDGSASFTVVMDGADFIDQFLSMRPFKCITGEQDWFCYLEYPYQLHNTVTANNLLDLEYNLLFIKKSKAEFGIDAWNGIYYKLSMDETGKIIGDLSQGDLNVLQSPPEAYSHPINPDEFFNDDAAKQRFPTLIIQP